VTSPRDARGGQAAGGDERDDRDAGDTNDELAGEDAKLRAMRSVWLSMREEEPSSGGLAELMAAARGKAAEMAPQPTWWQRAVAGLRRPPALAFATTLVLLGGAVVVSRHVARKGGELASDAAPAAARPAQAPAPQGAPAAGQAQLGPASARPGVQELDDSPVPEVAARKDAIAQGPVAAPPRRPAAKPLATTQQVDRRPSDQRSEDRVGGTVASQTLSDEASGVPSTRAAATGDPGAASAGSAPSERAPLEPAPVQRAPSDVPSSAAAAADAEKRERPAHLAKPQPGHVGSAPLALYRQCEAAAARGDCAEARRLVDQISTTDRGYRARIGKASRIGKCLAE
jgi:hypothetical protein